LAGAFMRLPLKMVMSAENQISAAMSPIRATGP
jgi:hypothetical protein